MLIDSTRFRSGDREAWRSAERADAVHAQTRAYRRRIEQASVALQDFATSGNCYAGTSWGKDSTCLAHLVTEIVPLVPLVWIRVEPIANPDCVLVRDAFLRDHPRCIYEEIARTLDGERPDSGALDDGFELASRKYGRYISGVRGEESKSRTKRMAAFGATTANTCAPLGWWTGVDVFAYLHANKLPVHPAYACTMGGLLDRERIRVATIGGERGTGHGRAEWERTYYPLEMPR